MQNPVKHQNLFNILCLGPLLIAPVLAVEVPRFLAYLPIISALLGGGVLVFLLKEKLVFPKYVVLFLGGVILLTGASALWAAEPEITSERALKLAPMLACYGLLIAVLQSGVRYVHSDILKFLLISCAAGAVLLCTDSILGLAIHRFIRDIPQDEYVSNVVLNRGAVSIVMLSLIPLLMFVKDRARIAAACILPIVIMITLVESQTSQLALFFAVLFYFVFPFSQKWAWIAVFAAFIIYALGKPFFAHWLYMHAASDLNIMPFLKDAYVGARLEIWDFTGRYTLNSPLLGYGVEITRTVEDFDSGQIYNPGYTTILHPHSFIMQTWIELGLLGILFAIAAVGAAMKGIYSIADQQCRNIALTILMTCLLISSFSYGMWQSWFLGLFCMLGGILAAINYRQPVQSGSAQTDTAP